VNKLVLVMTAVATVLAASGADARRGTPPLTLVGGSPDFAAMDHLVLPTPDLDEVFAKDRATTGRLRVAETLAVGRSMREAGTWEKLRDGSRRWRLRVSSTGAYFLAFQLSDFELPRGAEMHFISVERNYYDGPYGAGHNNPERRFGSAMVPGDSAVIEVWVPRGSRKLPNFRVDSVSWGYKNFRNILSVPYRDGRPVRIPEKALIAKADCDVDVNCPEGDAWQDEHRSVAEAFDGNFICSGQVLNSTDNTCNEYHYLTANHCFSKGKARVLVLFWNYENSACGANDAPIDMTTTGSTHLASGNASDFYLVRLDQVPPASFFVSQSGFDATGAAPASGVTMGFPNDVPMTISFENDPVVDGQSSGWGADHWRVNGWDVGGTAGGSSGGALWNEDHRVVGQLHGGTSSCGDGWDEFGKLSVSWAAGAASHLDPGGTGQLTTDLIDCFGGEPPPPPPPCELGQPGDPCTSNAECCSNSCRTNGRFANTCR
jgi:hypothetical protein